VPLRGCWYLFTGADYEYYLIGDVGDWEVPIRPFLTGHAFEPEVVREMSLAFESACEALGLRIRDDPATRLVAEKIIDLVDRGVRGGDQLRTMTLKEFNRSE